MSQKRKHGDSSVGDSETRHFAKKPRGDSKPAFKNNKRPHRPTRKLDTQSGTSNTALKNRIRDLRRLLDHADSDPKSRLPANVRIERERELEACEHELEEKLAAQKELELRRKMISKYHQVRFFDRQKATRILKRLRRDLASTEDPAQKAELEQKIHVAEVDLNYALYYPLMKVYSALFPKSKSGKAESEEPGSEEGANKTKGDPEMWRKIEEAMEKGEHALEGLRNWKPERETLVKKVEKKDKRKGGEGKKKESGKSKRTEEEDKAAVQDEDGESDGGFFE